MLLSKMTLFQHFQYFWSRASRLRWGLGNSTEMRYFSCLFCCSMILCYHIISSSSSLKYKTNHKSLTFEFTHVTTIKVPATEFLIRFAPSLFTFCYSEIQKSSLKLFRHFSICLSPAWFACDRSQGRIPDQSQSRLCT